MAQALDIIIVTGLSGAGRSTALHALEDSGYFCIDNLPPVLAPRVIEMATADKEMSSVALGVDVRTGAFLAGAAEIVDQLGEYGHNVQVIFLDCGDDVLVQRFSETRRRHALAPGGNILAAIEKERRRLGPLRARAKTVIDTTALSVHDLRRRIRDVLNRDSSSMIVRVTSFGFKYGIPVDADLVFDVRYLPNPHFDPDLRPLTGLDKKVSDYVLGMEETQTLLNSHLEPLLCQTLPLYAREGKSYLTVAIGCTGGKHRSVAISEELKLRLQRAEFNAVVHHREQQRYMTSLGNAKRPKK